MCLYPLYFKHLSSLFPLDWSIISTHHDAVTKCCMPGVLSVWRNLVGPMGVPDEVPSHFPQLVQAPRTVIADRFHFG